MKELLIIVFTILVIKLCNGQHSMSLTECIDFAFKHNLNLEQFRSETSKSVIIFKQARLKCLPTLNAEYNHFLSSGRSLNQELYVWENNDMQQGNMALAAELIIFQGFGNWHGLKSAKSNYESSLYALEKVKLQLGLEITKCYYEIMLSTKAIEVFELTHHNTTTELKSLHEQIDAGILSKCSLYELMAQSQKEQLQLEILKTGRDKHYLVLKEMMNWPPDDGFMVYSTPDDFDGPSSPVSFRLPAIDAENVLKNSPDIKEKELLMSATKHEIHRQRSQYYPVIRSVASISSRYMKNAIDPEMQSDSYEYLSQISDNQYKQLALSVTLPIFDRNSRNTAIKLAKIEYERLQNEKEMVQLALRNELLLIQVEINSLAESITISREMAEAFKKSYETATEKFRAGLLNSYELTLAKNNYTGALLELNKMKVQHSMNVALLDFYRSYAEY
ncbi:MAG: TolC family protein [Bacteroidales bacterium]|nr:TolC family protein [Bacteroidales bacterium]